MILLNKKTIHLRTIAIHPSPYYFYSASTRTTHNLGGKNKAKEDFLLYLSSHGFFTVFWNAAASHQKTTVTEVRRLVVLLLSISP